MVEINELNCRLFITIDVSTPIITAEYCHLQPVFSDDPVKYPGPEWLHVLVSDDPSSPDPDLVTDP